jgi:rod shape determining protein RodA
MLAEEFGMIGSLVLLGLFALVLVYGLSIALRCRHQFGRLVAMGVTSSVFMSMFINVAMVMGLIPVVGAPLPLVSYGGSAMMTILMGFGFVMSANVHRDIRIPRRTTILDT